MRVLSVWVVKIHINVGTCELVGTAPPSAPPPSYSKQRTIDVRAVAPGGRVVATVAAVTESTPGYYMPLQFWYL
jgi:hypothetical protein